MNKSLDTWLKDHIGYEIYEPGLARIKNALKLFDINPKAKIITIAGTNGKGETSRLLFKHLKEKYKCSLWTSPHLHSVTERFENNQGLISENILSSYFHETKKVIDHHNLKLSYYEFLFLIFMQFSKDSEIIVLEVGLGGRLDAVNSVDANYVLLTSISRDHQEYLGNSYKSILKEKCGVLRSGQKFYSNLELKFLRQHLIKIIKDFSLYHFDLFENEMSNPEDNFSIRNQKLVQYFLKNEFNINFDLDNRLPCSVIEEENSKFYWFSSHNVDGVRKSVQLMKRHKYNFDKVLLFLSERNLSDALTIIKILKTAYNKKTEIYLMSFEHPKAMRGDKLTKLKQETNLEIINDFKKELKINKSENVLCIGSNYSMDSLLGYFKS
jgi:dihydrofolate synthase/folylpolyglutamate synthase